MSLTPLQKQKMSRRFALLDTDKSGYLDADDYADMAERLIAGCPDASASSAQAVRDSYRELSRALVLAADEDGDGRISEDEFEASVSKLIDSGGYDDSIGRTAAAVLNMYDRDGSGELDREEFKVLFAAYGVSSSEADTAFARIDQDDSGKLSVEEIASAAKAFYTSDDPDAPGNVLFGGV
jgi:Ca2+-binding EF-hand superfamily protein